MALKHGTFAWHDCMTTDVDAAIDFYGKVLRLGTAPFDADYLMWTAGGVPIGGVMKLPDEAQAMGAPPHWLSYLAVDDVDETAVRALSMGGRAYVEPQAIPGGGKFAVLADPQGATFGIHMHAEAPDPGATPELEFTWHELVTTDVNAARTFYRELFGWEEQDVMDMGPGGMYHIFGLDGKNLGGMYNKPPDMLAPPHWLPYAHIDDADAFAETVTRHRGKILNGPVDVPGGGRVVQVADRQGAAFAVYQPPVQVAAPKPKPKPKAHKQSTVKKQVTKAAKTAEKKVEKKVRKTTKAAKKRVKRATKTAKRRVKKATKTAKKKVRKAVKAAKKKAKRRVKKAVGAAKKRVKRAVKTAKKKVKRVGRKKRR